MPQRSKGSGKDGALGGLREIEGIKRLENFLERSLESYKNPENHEWMTTILPHLTIISHSASPPHPSITFRLTVRPIHCNGGGNLHGGCTSTIFDGCTTMLLHLVSKPGYWQFLGVSRTLNVTYLRPVPVGTTVDIRCEILQLGRRLCTLRGEMRAVDGREEGPVLAVCEHGKVNTDPPPAEKL